MRVRDACHRRKRQVSRARDLNLHREQRNAMPIGSVTRDLVLKARGRGM